MQDLQTVQSEDFIFGKQTFHKGEHFPGHLAAGKSADAQLEYQKLKLLTADLIQFNH